MPHSRHGWAMALSYWSWTRARVGDRSFIVSFKRFFVLGMHSFLGTGDSSMMRIKIPGDLFLFMTVWATFTEVTILRGKLETRQVFFVNRCNWRSRESTD